MNLREAAERALDALEDIFGKEKKDVGAINALRQALAQPEQEPVAWSDVVSDGGLDPRNVFDTAPPKKEWVGLTDEEIYDYADKFLYQHGSNYGIRSFGKAIEAKLKEKNG